MEASNRFSKNGAMIGWKKTKIYSDTNILGHPNIFSQSVLVKLLIPKYAKRVKPDTFYFKDKKYRASHAKVLGMWVTKGNKRIEVKVSISLFDHNFIYRTGKIVSVDNFNENNKEECTYGIHFFLDKKRAINY